LHQRSGTLHLVLLGCILLLFRPLQTLGKGLNALIQRFDFIFRFKSLQLGNNAEAIV